MATIEQLLNNNKRENYYFIIIPGVIHELFWKIGFRFGGLLLYFSSSSQLDLLFGLLNINSCNS